MDIHKNLNQTTELDSARNDLSVEKKLLDCIENLVMNDDRCCEVIVHDKVFNTVKQLLFH